MLWTYQTSHWHLQNVNKCGTFCGIEPKPIKMLNSIVGNKPWRRPVSGRTVAPAPWPHGSAYRRSRRRKCSNKVCESSSPSSGSSTWRLWPSCQDELLGMNEYSDKNVKRKNTMPDQPRRETCNFRFLSRFKTNLKSYNEWKSGH